ncbi:unnamed protein product [Ceutorhynchus assimilis]|uniref:Endonuclease/exonuclease/phosphatase domain-containing protein n=1 Tax=Ceutorhynchus assimilis TaxID=467358 RepID=A0A9N9Q8M4_9CUCU|nr:unnamed protein product [Ceutorhynchus assimilis]
MNTLYSPIIQWNINGYLSHLERLQLLIHDENPSIIALQETHFRDDKLLCPKKFKGFYRNRTNRDRASGGVAIFTKEELKAVNVPLTTNLEAVAASIPLPQPLTICNIYIPPDREFNK